MKPVKPAPLIIDNTCKGDDTNLLNKEDFEGKVELPKSPAPIAFKALTSADQNKYRNHHFRRYSVRRQSPVAKPKPVTHDNNSLFSGSAKNSDNESNQSAE